jgi:hypothetical protein
MTEKWDGLSARLAKGPECEFNWCCGKASKEIVVGDGFASVTPCRECGHTTCGPDCRCDGKSAVR